MSLIESTDAAIKAATHLTKMDAGAIEAMRNLARKIDAWDVIVGWALEDAQVKDHRPTVPQNDNVSISAYLKYSESLGLTPASRGVLVPKPVKAAQPQKPEAKDGKLARLSSVPKPA